ncbi:inositol 1,4,5-triphosphate receptor associated 2-like [Mustelus asterias]
MEKTKLENQIVMQQELASESINLPEMFSDRHDLTRAPGSLQAELLNAQCVSEMNGSEWSKVSEPNTLSFNETLDKEVLMLMQSPGTEEATVQFKVITAQMAKELSEEIEALVTWLQQIGELKINCKVLNKAHLEHLKRNLQERKQLWLQSICVLEDQRLAADREYIRMASNFRRSKTEQLHQKRKEATRLHGLEAQKQLTEQTAAALELQLQLASQQLSDLQTEIGNRNAELASVREGTEVLQHELGEAVVTKHHLQSINQAQTDATEALQQKLKQQQTTIQSLREELFQQELCGLQSQTRDRRKELQPEVAQCEGQRQAADNSLPCIQQWGIHSSVTTYACTPLLDALMLEHFHPVSRFQICSGLRSNNLEHRKPMMSNDSANDELSDSPARCELHAVGVQAESELSVPGMSDKLLDKAAAGKDVDSCDLLQPSEDLKQHQLNIPCIITPENSSMSGPSAPHTSTKQPDNGLQLQETIKTLDVVGEKHDDVCDTIKDGASGGPVAMDTSQLISKLVNFKRDQPGSRAKVKINLEATRGSVAVDELSSSELHANYGSPVCSLDGTNPPPDSKSQDLFNLQSASATEQEVEAEFLRFSLAFKCDMFTLDKRLRLEERSRDLAETNLKKEIEKCQQMLQTVKSLCEEEQSLEAFEKLEKSLTMLMQITSRVASRAEMLGAIHQETRVSKAVEVMIQYVENLKRMYVKEHTELEEMKQLLLQNNKASSLFGENRDELRSKKFLPVQTFGKNAARRVSIAAIPRSTGGPLFDLSKLKEADEGRRRSEGDQDKLRNKLTRKMSTWKFLGHKENDPSLSRPTLHRFISTYTWGDKGGQLENKGGIVPALESREEEKEEEMEEVTLTEAEYNSPNAEPCVVYRGISDHLATLWDAFPKRDRGPWLPVLLLFSLSVLGSFLIGWSFHTSVDAASVPIGDTWKAIQQFLWPYTELRHDGQPPV